MRGVLASRQRPKQMPNMPLCEHNLDPLCCPECGENDREKLASWMLANGFATGHGDTMDDLLRELTWQIEELRGQRTGHNAK